MYEPNLSRIRQNKKTQAVAATIAVLSLETAILNNAYAADKKPTAPLEERLDKAPKMPFPEQPDGAETGVGYTPKMPQPFEIDRFYIPSQAAKNAQFDNQGRTYQGSIDISGNEYTIRFIIGLKERASHRAILQTGEGSMINAVPFEDGSEIYLSGSVGVAQFKLPDGSRIYGIFDYITDEPEQSDEYGNNKIETVIGMRVTRGIPITSEVRGGKDLQGKVLVSSSIVCEGKEGCYELPEQDGPASGKFSTDLLEDRIDHVSGEVRQMIDAGSEERDVLAYIAQAKRMLAAELDADLRQNSPVAGNDLGLVPLVSPEETVHNRFQSIYNMIEDNYATPEVIGKTPLEKESMEDVKHPELVGVKTQTNKAEEEQKTEDKPEIKPGEKQEGHKTAGLQGPRKIDLTTPLPEEDILEAVPYTPPEDVEPDTGEDEWYETWWFWTVVGSVVAAGVGTGLGIYLSQDNDGGQPQPPVGTPTMQPWDKL